MKKKIEKIIRDGKVAVLYSPGFGAGWSTWNDSKFKQIIFHPKIVELVENKQIAKITEGLVKKLLKTKDYICVLGRDDLRIKWIPEGVAFKIDEYDGSESITISGSEEFMEA